MYGTELKASLALPCRALSQAVTCIKHGVLIGLPDLQG